MKRDLYPMTIEKVPHSSVVGTSLKIVSKKHGVVAILAIMVPQPNLDYRTIADATASAILDGHVSARGCTLVLPTNIGEPK